MKRIYGYGLLRSMRISFRNFFRPPITVQYPHEKVELPERSRWAVRMKYDENGEHKCTACGLCEKACHLGMIHVDAASKKAFKCDLCDGEPQCVTYCPQRVLTYKERRRR